MIATPIKTHKITEKDRDIFQILDQYLVVSPHPSLSLRERVKGEGIIREKSVVAVTSKIVAICEGRMIAIKGTKETQGAEETNEESDPAFAKSFGEAKKDELIKREADWYLSRTKSKFNIMLTIKNNMLVASAGVDESNAFGHYILWPQDLQKSANMIREHLVKKFGIKNLGVVITDSKTTPLRWGVTGVSLAHSGFNALKNYIGTPDLFERLFEFEKLNIADSLAAAAVLTMGEGREQQPLAVIEDLPFVQFQDRNPSEEELASLKINREDDLYEPLLTSVEWEKRK